MVLPELSQCLDMWAACYVMTKSHIEKWIVFSGPIREMDSNGVEVLDIREILGFPPPISQGS